MTRAALHSRDERVEYIVSLMHQARWERGRTGRDLALEWGCSLTTMGTYAAEASRIVCREGTDRHRVTATISVLLERTAMESYEDAQQYRMMGMDGSMAASSARTALIAACKTWAQIAERVRVEDPQVETDGGDEAANRAALESALAALDSGDDDTDA